MAKRAPPSATMSFRFTVKLRKALEKAADDDERSVNSLVRLILTQWLEAQGYLK
jgi:hypothetical protein